MSRRSSHPRKFPPFESGRALILLTAWLALALPGSRANPLGEAVRHGNVTFERVDGQLRILQASDRAIIDWESFSIGAGELTEFLQPGPRSAALNRVRGTSASAIEGALRANGRVYLINPNGILVGPGGTIDVGGFVASTLDVSDGEFLAGGDLNFAGASQAGIVNLGSISALDGDVILIAATVENAGTIRAPKGTAALAAGNDVLLAESGAERVFVRGASGGSKANGVTNTGNIEANIAELKAHGGNIYGMAVKNEGRVAATGVTREGGQIFLRANGGPVRTTGTLKARRSDGSGGRIEIDSGAEGRIEVGGEVDARGDSGQGGEIVVLGREIDVLPGSLVLADGETGGGSILIGGGLRGEDPAYANAENVTVGEGATLSANALTSGNGGRVIVFAEDSLTFLGNLSATGGPLGGDGGFVELSGKNSVTIPNLAGRVDLSALKGQAGTLLFDPINTSIRSSPVTAIGGSPISANTLRAADIAAFLNTSGSLVVETNVAGTGEGDIEIRNNVGISWNSANSLTFNAFRDFTMLQGSSIQSSGTGGVTVNSGRDILLDRSTISTANTGAVSLNSSRSMRLEDNSLVSVVNGDLSMNANTGSVSVTGPFIGIWIDDSMVKSAGTGDISLVGRGGEGATSTGLYGINLTDGAIISSSASGLAAGEIFVQGTGGLGATFNHGVFLEGAGTAVTSQDGAITITGVGGGGGTFTSGSFPGGPAFPGGGNTGGVFPGRSNNGSVTGFYGENQGVRADSGAIIEGLGTANITITGTGGKDDFSDGVMLDGNDTGISGVGGQIKVIGTGGGTLAVSDKLNRGILIDGASIVAQGNAGVEMIGNGGIGFSEIDGIHLQDGALVEIENGNLVLTGVAGGTLGIGVMATANSGGINVAGTGTVEITGTGVGASGVSLSNPAAELGGANAGSIMVEALAGDVILKSLTTAKGAVGISSAAETAVQGAVESAMGDITIRGHNIDIDRTVTATLGQLAFEIDDLGSSSSGTIHVNETITAGAGLSFAGGGGTADTITYAGYVGVVPIDFYVNDLTDIEFLTGPTTPGDWFHGPATASTYQMNGPDAWDVSGVSVIGFENLAGGAGLDRFVFADGAQISGQLQGGGGSNQFDFIAYLSAVDVNFQNGTVAGIVGGFSGVDDFIGQGADSSFIGPNSPTNYIVTGANDFSFGMVTVTDFASLTGGPNADSFRFRTPGGFSGILDGGGGTNSIDFAAENFGSPASINYQTQKGSGFSGSGTFSNITRFIGQGSGYAFTGPDAATTYTVTGENVFTFGGVTVIDFANLTAGLNADTFLVADGAELTGQLQGGGSSNQLDLSAFTSAVSVDFQSGTVAGIIGGFSGINDFVGQGALSTFSGPTVATIYLIDGENEFTFGTVRAADFANLTGGAEDDVFAFLNGANLTGVLDGGLAATFNRLDYSLFGADVSVDLGSLPNAMATGIGGGILRITDFLGSAGVNDSFTGPDTAATYQLTGMGEFDAGNFRAGGFENLTGGSAADTFAVSPGAGLPGQLAGGSGIDTLIAGDADDVFVITANHAGNLNGNIAFFSFENLDGAGGDDQFKFFNQATVALIHGGIGNDSLFLDDSGLGGINTYTITTSSITRNPVYTFGGIEILELLLGGGNDTVNTQAFVGLTQMLDGGPGTDTLNVPGLLIDVGSPFGPISFLHFELPVSSPGPVPNPPALPGNAPGSNGPGNPNGTTGPRTNGNLPSTGGFDLGGILQIQLDQPQAIPTPFGNTGFQTQNNFTLFNPVTLFQNGTAFQGGFSAGVFAGQGLVIFVDRNPSLILVPFSLDGSGLPPSAAGMTALAQNLGVGANIELGAAIGFTGPIYLVQFDGAFAIDLSGVPVDAAVLTALQESLSYAAMSELYDALGMTVAYAIFFTDGPTTIDPSNGPPSPAALGDLEEELSIFAMRELYEALELPFVIIITPPDGPVVLWPFGPVPDQAISALLTGHLTAATLAELAAAIGAIN